MEGWVANGWWRSFQEQSVGVVSARTCVDAGMLNRHCSWIVAEGGGPKVQRIDC